MDDSELIQAVRVGDHEAFGRLVERYQAAICRLCLRVTGNVPDAEELAHDAFVEAYLKLHQLRDPAKFAPWLKQVALNLCRLWYRRQRRETALIEEPAAPEGGEPSLSARVSGGLSQLSPAHRLVLVLHYWEALSYDEIARFLGVPAGTVMSRLYRARRELKQRMEAMEEDDEMVETPDEGFRQEVEAEIAVLLAMFGENAEARERLSVILRRSPERFAALVAQAPDEQRLADLARLLRRLGRPAMEVVLAGCFSPNAGLQTRAATVLRHFIAAAQSGSDGPAGMARLDVYLLLDSLLASPAPPAARARLLDDLLAVGPAERTALLLANGLLCFPEEALPRLLDRFWAAVSPAVLYGPGSPLYALSRTGTRFAAALLEPLRRGDARRQALALAGAEAVARSLRLWFDLERPADDRAALEARFRWKWAPPLQKDRDPAVLEALAHSVAALLTDVPAEEREAALRILGLLKAEAHREQIETCVRHPDAATRRAALRALADLGTENSAPRLMEVARGGSPAEQREAIRALGRLRTAAAEPLLAELLEHPDPEVGQAAALALGDVGGPSARAALQALLARPGPLRREAARALHAGVSGVRPSLAERERGGRPPVRPGRMTEIIRGGAHPPFYIALDAAIRALPALQPYDEAALSRHISQACVDWAGARRRLIEERLMRREGGIYRFTERGEAVWRVEQFIRGRCSG